MRLDRKTTRATAIEQGACAEIGGEHGAGGATTPTPETETIGSTVNAKMGTEEGTMMR